MLSERAVGERARGGQTTHGAFFFSVRGSYATLCTATAAPELAAPPFNDALQPFSKRKNVRLAMRMPSVMSTYATTTSGREFAGKLAVRYGDANPR